MFDISSLAFLKTYFVNLFNYIYGYLLDTRVLLDSFSFSENNILSDFFGAIHYILGDTIYMYFYTLIVISLGLILYKLFKRVLDALVT